jgi:hypothetical protein
MVFDGTAANAGARSRSLPVFQWVGYPATFWRLVAGKETLFASGAGGYSGRMIGVDWEFFAGRSAVDSVSVEPIGPGASCAGPISLLQAESSAPATMIDAARAGIFRFMLRVLPCAPVMERRPLSQVPSGHLFL